MDLRMDVPEWMECVFTRRKGKDTWDGCTGCLLRDVSIPGSLLATTTQTRPPPTPNPPRSFIYFTRGPALALLVVGLLALLDVVIFYFG